MQMYNPPHPGEILKDLYMDALNLNVTKTAEGLGVTRKTLSELINKKSGISVEMAIRLSVAFDTSPEMWLNLQKEYNLWKIKDRINTKKIVHFFNNVNTLSLKTT